MVKFEKTIKKHPFIKGIDLDIKEGDVLPVILGNKIKVEVFSKYVSGTVFLPVEHFTDNGFAKIVV